MLSIVNVFSHSQFGETSGLIEAVDSLGQKATPFKHALLHPLTKSPRSSTSADRTTTSTLSEYTSTTLWVKVVSVGIAGSLTPRISVSGTIPTRSTLSVARCPLPLLEETPAGSSMLDPTERNGVVVYPLLRLHEPWASTPI